MQFTRDGIMFLIKSMKKQIIIVMRAHNDRDLKTYSASSPDEQIPSYYPWTTIASPHSFPIQQSINY